jgi:predicted nucleic acid-binding protein
LIAGELQRMESWMDEDFAVLPRFRARGSILADFLVGAHAAVLQIPILTRDVTRFRAYFPTVRLVNPE